MKTFPVPAFATALVMFVLTGCGALDLTPSGNPDRVLTGTVSAGTALPQGAEIVVRLLAPPSSADVARPAGPTDLPVVTRPAAERVENVLGEQTQTLAAGTIEPVPFRVPYYADDALLQRGLQVEVRVSVGGKLRFRSMNTHVVTLASSRYPQEVVVQAVAP